MMTDCSEEIQDRITNALGPIQPGYVFGLSVKPLPRFRKFLVGESRTRIIDRYTKGTTEVKHLVVDLSTYERASNKDAWAADCAAQLRSLEWRQT